jgi:hypothetical protein
MVMNRHRGTLDGTSTLLLLASTLALSACSSSGSSHGTQPLCNTVVDDAPAVTATATAATAPSPTGGTITPGTYELSSMTLYVGPDGLVAAPPGELSQVFVITDAKIEQAAKVNDVENHATTSFTVAGTTLSTKDTCPAPRSEDLEFTATEADFRVYVARRGGTFEQVYTLRSN